MPPLSLDQRLTAALTGRYEVQRELGRGGMATVYLARDLRHERPVAVKVLASELHTGVNPQRFLSEIRTAANLHHPHILPLYDSGEADGLLYYTMPFVEGVTLQERIRSEGPLDVGEALRVLAEVGDGLAHAHRQGLVHRDVKPSNILLSNGHALLADFGLARAVEGGALAGLTQTGSSVGTPLYMSPEQASGTDAVDARSDIYSLGCVLYEMLTGEPPFQKATPLALMAAHAFEEVPSVAALRPDLPATIAPSIARAMAKAPEDRFVSVDDFVGAVSGDVDVTPLPGRVRQSRASAVASLGSRAKAGTRSLPWKVAAAVAVGVASVAFILLNKGSVESGQGGPLLVADRVVIAPLENRSGDPALEEVGRMAADWITEGLHSTGIVDVVPSLTALQAAGYVRTVSARTDTVVSPIAALALETGAGKVVSGAYYRDGDALLFQMQVTDAITGELLDALDPVRGDPLAPAAAIGQLRDYVMGSLAVNLDERLVNAELAQLQPPSYESYRAFDEGMQLYLASRWSPAAESFRRAFAIDSTFVLSLLYLTLTEANIAPRGGGPVMDSLTQALAARRGQFAAYHQHWIDYLSARVHGRNDEARVAIQKAAELAPESKAVYNYAFTAQLTHRPREAVEALRSIDPERGPMRGWFPYWTLLTDNLHRLGEHRDELAAALRAAELYPQLGWSFIQVGHALAALGDAGELRRLSERLATAEMQDVTPADVWIAIAEELRFHGHADLAEEFHRSALQWLDALPEAAREEPGRRLLRATVLQGLGQYSEARDIIRGAVDANPGDLTLLGWLGILEAWVGNASEAERISAHLVEEERRDPYARGFYLLQCARIAGALGQADRATEFLRGSVAGGFRPLRHPDSNFEPVRGYPPLEEAFKPVGE